jgi:hypothetical protein
VSTEFVGPCSLDALNQTIAEYETIKNSLLSYIKIDGGSTELHFDGNLGGEFARHTKVAATLPQGETKLLDGTALLAISVVAYR